MPSPKKKSIARDKASGSRFQDEILGVLWLTVTVIVFLSLLSFDPYDTTLYTDRPNTVPHNLIGIAGAYLSGILFFLCGLTAYLAVIVVLIMGLRRLFKRKTTALYSRLFGTVLLFLSASALVYMLFSGRPNEKSGGLLGFVIAGFLVNYFGRIGAFIIATGFVLISSVIATEFAVIPVFIKIVRVVGKFFARLLVELRDVMTHVMRARSEARPCLNARPEAKKTVLPPSAQKREPFVRPATPVTGKIQEKDQKPKITIATPPAEKSLASSRKDAMKDTPKRNVVSVSSFESPVDYKLPTSDLLLSPPPIEEREIKESLEESSKILEETLLDFGIEVKVKEVERGPVITRYELEPAPGVKVNRITALSDDIALAMKAHSVRIVAPIPGKARVGVEVPNTTTAFVYLKEVVESLQFQPATLKIPLAIGKDIAGEPLIEDLAAMPHLLIAGTTGSGKTVCINGLIVSLLFKFSPDHLQFIMIDPKMVELSCYNDLPHLLCPVITSAKQAKSALEWAVSEMESRYQLFAKLGVRNIEMFNTKKKNGDLASKSESDIEIPHKIPYIVIVIDELADLMLLARDEIEDSITRLTQLSRAVGIHLVLATQRPSVDVITGVIKANFPARISFKVASKVDSRTVLDANGADKLLGRGDLLFLKPGTSKLIRAQGCLLSDGEIERIVDSIKKQLKPRYNEDILKSSRDSSMRFQEDDEMYDEAVKVVMQSRQASVSILQRRLRLGYTRAARLIDIMEAKGIVGPYRGSKPREILIEDYAQLEQKESSDTERTTTVEDHE